MENMVLCKETSLLVEKLFTIFYALCAGFDSQFQDVKKLGIVKTQWIIAFIEHGMKTEDDIASGLVFLRKQKKLIYIPAVGDFLDWCERKEKESFLSPDKAYRVAYEILRGEMKQPYSPEQILVIQHAISATDSHFMKNSSRNTTEPVFHRNYEIAIRDMMDGKLRPIPKALDNTEHEAQIKAMKRFGIMPCYAHLKNRQECMQVIEGILKRAGTITRELPYDKNRRS